MEKTNLLNASERALADGNLLESLNLLKSHNRSNNTDALLWHRQGVLEEQVGDYSAAGIAHYRCMQLAPANHIGYLYLGAWLAKSSMNEAAAAAFSIAQDINPTSLHLSNDHTASEPTKSRSQIGNKVMRGFMTAHQKKVTANAPSTSRAKEALWARTNDEVIHQNDPMYCPELFFIPSLEKRPVFHEQEFTWSDILKKAYTTIRKELLSFIGDANDPLLRPYLPKEMLVQDSLKQLAGSLNWSAADLFHQGQLNDEISGFFPETLNVIRQLPTYGLDDTPYEAFFSILKPQQVIAPHFGQSNHSLNVHLPIIVPPNCHLNVAEKQYQWIEGTPLIFDDSYIHSAHNLSSQARIVLIFNVWHPELNSEDQKLIQQSFMARKNWLDSRHSLLDKALEEAN